MWLIELTDSFPFEVGVVACEGFVVGIVWWQPALPNECYFSIIFSEPMWWQHQGSSFPPKWKSFWPSKPQQTRSVPPMQPPLRPSGSSCGTIRPLLVTGTVHQFYLAQTIRVSVAHTCMVLIILCVPLHSWQPFFNDFSIFIAFLSDFIFFLLYECAGLGFGLA